MRREQLFACVFMCCAVLFVYEMNELVKGMAKMRENARKFFGGNEVNECFCKSRVKYTHTHTHA